VDKCRILTIELGGKYSNHKTVTTKRLNRVL